MRKRNGYLIDYAIPTLWNYVPILMFAVDIFVFIMPSNDEGSFSFFMFLFFMSYTYGMAIVITFIAYISVCRRMSIKSFWKIIKPDIIRGGIILVGASLAHGVIALSLLDIFDEDFFISFIRLGLMIGGPIVIGMLTFLCISSVEDEDYLDD